MSLSYGLSQRNLRGVSIDLKLTNLDLSGNTTEFKTLPMRPRSHRYILIYKFAMESVKICRFKTFWVGIFARATLLLFRCFNVHVKICVLLSYCARKWRRLCTSFKSCSTDLCHALSMVARQICTTLVDPSGLKAFVACRAPCCAR